VFGICLGNQLLGLSAGARTLKMPYGHRGLNHPVKNLLTGLAEITSQNHGFSIDADSLAAAPDIELTHVNLNDHSVEGIRLRGKNAFSVQYHPESNPGPHDSAYLFDQFVAGLS
jgi:carbamoyl-phosphate synthase small subunit